MNETRTDNERLNKYSAILHDWDDTIVRTFKNIYELFVAFAIHLNIPAPTLEDLQKHWGKSPKNLVESLWNIEGIFELYANYVPLDFSHPAIEGVVETIFKLKEEGYILGIVTSSSKRGLARTLGRTILLPDETYTVIVTSDDCEYQKPDPRVFTEALNVLDQLGIGASHTLYVGDGINDFYSARDAGLDFIAFTKGRTTSEDFIRACLDNEYILSSFCDLQNF